MKLVRLFLYENKCFIIPVIYNNLKAKFASFTEKITILMNKKMIKLLRLFLYENKCFITPVIYNNLKAKFATFTVKSIHTQKNCFHPLKKGKG